MGVIVTFEDRSGLWGNSPAGEAGYIECGIDDLAAQLHMAVLIEDGAKALLLSHPDVGLVSIAWEPEMPDKDSCVVVTRADVDRTALLQFLRMKFGSELNIVVYPEAYDIV